MVFHRPLAALLRLSRICTPLLVLLLQAVTHIIISVAFVVNVTTDLDWQRSSPDLPFGFEHVIVLAWVGTAIARAMVFLAERLSAECRAMLSGGQFPQLEEDCSTQGSIKFAKANAQNS